MSRLSAAQLARRAYKHALDPNRNPIKAAMDAASSVRAMPPMLGLFNDIPAGKLREDEAQSWALAGFSWVCNDGEHSQLGGRYGREQNACLLRQGLLPVARLHREAVSEHGDALTTGARATMRPYGTTLAEADRYLRAVSYPPGTPGGATADDRGGFPVRRGDRSLVFTPDALRAAERGTQGWLQFETTEYLLDEAVRDAVLARMAAEGANKAVGFVGPFDALMRGGHRPEMPDAINALFRAAADEHGVAMGRVVGSGAMTDPALIEDGMVEAIEHGCRLLAVHYMASDCALLGASRMAEPFFRAARRCGFTDEQLLRVDVDARDEDVA